VPLDGSSLAEAVLPVVSALTASHGVEMILLQTNPYVFGDGAEIMACDPRGDSTSRVRRTRTRCDVPSATLPSSGRDAPPRPCVAIATGRRGAPGAPMRNLTVMIRDRVRNPAR
jgi:hypothetical protein